MKIGIDMMGGDYAPEATVKGTILAKNELDSDVELVLYGDQSALNSAISASNQDPKDFTIVHCSQNVEMTDHPTRVLAQKPDASISKAFRDLKAKNIDAFASAGNTGAMLVGAMYSVNSIPGIIRPCITTFLPREDGSNGLLLDVGANADCKPDVLYQFAILGSVYAESVMGIKNPKVGLLNIGEEPEKGNLLAQATHELMKDSEDFNFTGNIEGRDLFENQADVVVCDGFTGNVVLKEAEAFYRILMKRKLMDSYIARFNYELYGGTAVLGVNGNVVIGHGISNATAIKNMIKHSVDVVNAGLTEKIKLALNNE